MIIGSHYRPKVIRTSIKLNIKWYSHIGSDVEDGTWVLGVCWVTKAGPVLKNHFNKK